MTLTEAPRIDSATRDAEAVQRALAGEREAMGEIYDRYADRIHTMCVHMLGDADEAADACAQVFLVALQRLHQLREPAKLRSWLYAIARNEVYRRTEDRARTRPVEDLDDMAALAVDPSGLEAPAVDATTEHPVADQQQLAELVQTAAGGLDERDRMVLELNVSQGLAGQELADALGVGLDNAYQLTHRMRQRFERSAAALLVVSAGRDQCGDLDHVASRWDGTYDVLWRKRFARHVDGCDRCQRMKSRLPKAVLAGAALSQAAQSAVLAAPISIRDRLIAEGPSLVGSSKQRRWSRDGFPRSRPRRRLLQGATALLAGLCVVLGVGVVLDEGTRRQPTQQVSDPVQAEPDSTGVDPEVTRSDGPAGVRAAPSATQPGTNARGGDPQPSGPATGVVPDHVPGGSDTAPGPTEPGVVAHPTTPVDPPTVATPPTSPGGEDPDGGVDDAKYPRTGPRSGPTAPDTAPPTGATPPWDPKDPPLIWVPPTIGTPPALVPSTTIPTWTPGSVP